MINLLEITAEEAKQGFEQNQKYHLEFVKLCKSIGNYIRMVHKFLPCIEILVKSEYLNDLKEILESANFLVLSKEINNKMCEIKISWYK